jgi:hypothetical protein
MDLKEYNKMNKMNETPVMMTRQEYEELVKLRIIKQNAIRNYSPREDSLPCYICIDTALFDDLFPNELEVKSDDV